MVSFSYIDWPRIRLKELTLDSGRANNGHRHIAFPVAYSDSIDHFVGWAIKDTINKRIRREQDIVSLNYYIYISFINKYIYMCVRIYKHIYIVDVEGLLGFIFRRVLNKFHL